MVNENPSLCSKCRFDKCIQRKHLLQFTMQNKHAQKFDALVTTHSKIILQISFQERSRLLLYCKFVKQCSTNSSFKTVSASNIAVKTRNENILTNIVIQSI
jgi:hypothetical protein